MESIEGIPDYPPTPLKHDQDKVRLELLPPEFLIGVSKVLTFGAKKYSPGNWSVGDGFEWSRLYGAMLRHLTAWASGEETDPESGLSHLYHAGCMLAFLCAHMERGLGKDDRQEIGIRSIKAAAQQMAEAAEKQDSAWETFRVRATARPVKAR
jgi:hypothetical protein